MKKRFTALMLMLAILIIPAAAAKTYRQQIAVEYGISLNINGQQAVLTDPNGKTVQPFVYNGTTYVPIRAVSENLGATVGYDKTTNTATVMLAGVGTDLQWFNLLLHMNDYLAKVDQTIDDINYSSFADNQTSSDVDRNKKLVSILDGYANEQLVGYLSYFEDYPEEYANAKNLVDQCCAISSDLNEFCMHYSNFMQIPTQYSSEAMTAVQQRIIPKVSNLEDIIWEVVSTMEKYL